MSIEKLRPINDLGQLDAGELERMADYIEGLYRSSTGVGASQVQSDAGNLIIPEADKFIWAYITATANSSNQYPYYEVVETSTPGSFTTKVDGYTHALLPLVEAHLITGVAAATIVRAWLSDDWTHFIFDGRDSAWITVDIPTKVCAIFDTPVTLSGGTWTT